MGDFKFADRYAEAGLKPNAEIIMLRSETAKRITSDITNDSILDLVGTCYENPEVDLTWLRDEFAAEDASFSLVNNERETRVLAAAMLRELIDQSDPVAILAVVVGSVAGKRRLSVSQRLLIDAKEGLGRVAVETRAPKRIETKIVPTATKELAAEIKAVTQNDWPALVAIIDKVRADAQSSVRSSALQATSALGELSRQMDLMREESQMLWWLFGGHSRGLNRSFATFTPLQAAVVGAIDLGTLTVKSELGPVAASAVLERVIALAKKPKGQPKRELSAIIDTFVAADLEHLKATQSELPSWLAPITTAISVAHTIGLGSWHAKFEVLTGLDASVEFDPLPLAEQLYLEHLLGQLL